MTFLINDILAKMSKLAVISPKNQESVSVAKRVYRPRKDKKQSSEAGVQTQETGLKPQSSEAGVRTQEMFFERPAHSRDGQTSCPSLCAGLLEQCSLRRIVGTHILDLPASDWDKSQSFARHLQECAPPTSYVAQCRKMPINAVKCR